MGPVKVFLDANILFSAAAGGPSFKLLWELSSKGHLRLVTTQRCADEAAFNLQVKKPEALGRLPALLAAVERTAVPKALLSWAGDYVVGKDAHVLAAAEGCKADVLLTGDRKHFGKLMSDGRLRLRVRTVRRFLLDGPEGAK